MAYRSKYRRGVGQIPGCDSWFNRLINYPYCQTAESIQASMRPITESIYGEAAVPNPPPVPRSTMPDGSDIPPVPEDEADAQRTVDAIVAQQGRDWQAQNQSFFERVNRQLNSGTNWLVWAGLGLGAFAIVTLGGGSPRRYGR